jgi:hypothetical protein
VGRAVRKFGSRLVINRIHKKWRPLEGDRDTVFDNICMFSPQSVPVDTRRPPTISRPKLYSLVTISTGVWQCCLSVWTCFKLYNCINCKLASEFYLSLASEKVLAVEYICTYLQCTCFLVFRSGTSEFELACNVWFSLLHFPSSLLKVSPTPAGDMR